MYFESIHSDLTKAKCIPHISRKYIIYERLGLIPVSNILDLAN